MAKWILVICLGLTISAGGVLSGNGARKFGGSPPLKGKSAGYYLDVPVSEISGDETPPKRGYYVSEPVSKDTLSEGGYYVSEPVYELPSKRGYYVSKPISVLHSRGSYYVSEPVSKLTEAPSKKDDEYHL